MTRHRCPGFTLLEVLVAMSIFALVSVVAYSGLRTAVDAKRSSDTADARLAELQRAYAVASRDFRQLAPRGVRSAFGDTEPPLLTEVGEVRLTRAGRGNPLEFNRSEFVRVGYRLSADGELVRLVWPALDQPIDASPAEMILVAEVDALGLRFLGDDDRWFETWPPANAEPEETSLPQAVELTLELEDYGELRWLFASPR